MLTALQQMDTPVPVEVQDELNTVGKGLPESVSQLHVIAKSYAPLNQKYRLARLVLQNDFAERLIFTKPELDNPIQARDVEALELATSVLMARDSVTEAHRLITASRVFSQVLIQLQQYKEVELREPRTDSRQEQKSAPKMASVDKAMHAFLDTVEEWADVYHRLAES